MKHLRILLYAIVIAAACAMAGCSRTSALECARQAQGALDSGDTARARELCDEAMTAKDSDGLSASQLAPLSLIYMKIAACADHDDGAPVGMAVNAYQRAIAMPPHTALL